MNVGRALASYDRFEPWLRGRIDPWRLRSVKAALRSEARALSSSLYRYLYVSFFLLPLALVAGLAVLANGLAGLFGHRRSEARNGLTPLRAAWWRRTREAEAIRGIPWGLAILRPVLIWGMRMSLYGMLIALAGALIVGGILFPPLGLGLVITGFVLRRMRKKGKS